MAPLRVLDTTVLVDHLRGSSEAHLFLAAFDEPPLASEMVRAEVIRGVRSPERADAERLFGLIGWVPVGEGIARLAGDYGRRYRRSRQGIGLADLIVAATATDLARLRPRRTCAISRCFRGCAHRTDSSPGLALKGRTSPRFSRAQRRIRGCCPGNV